MDSQASLTIAMTIPASTNTTIAPCSHSHDGDTADTLVGLPETPRGARPQADADHRDCPVPRATQPVAKAR
jgi:hypothetical protein